MKMICNNENNLSFVCTIGLYEVFQRKISYNVSNLVEYRIPFAIQQQEIRIALCRECKYNLEGIQE
jgi:hypothetical protein